jgi:hypothetical protein
VVVYDPLDRHVTNDVRRVKPARSYLLRNMKSEDKCMLRNDYVGRLSTHAVSVTFILHNNPVDCVVANKKYQRKNTLKSWLGA